MDIIILKEYLPIDWYEKLINIKEFDEIKFNDFLKQISFDYENETIYPSKNNLFRAFKETKFNEVKLVIFGQDPYHDGSADGLAFSNSTKKDKISPSLRNIFKELEIEYKEKRTNTNLIDWAQQGILLLNTVLTVKKHQPNSYKNSMWNEFTNCIIKTLNTYTKNIIYLLLGNNAQQLKNKIDVENNFVIEVPHPSPLSAYHGFFNSNCFLKVNEILKSIGKESINFINKE